MTAVEYLSQAYHLDIRINSKIDQVASLNDLAHKATAIVSGMPHSPNRGKSTMADTIDKIIDLQEEINRDIDRLVDLKAEIVSVIKAVENTEYQALLEKRYLFFMTWESISSEMNYGLRWTHIMHNRALDAVTTVLKKKGIA